VVRGVGFGVGVGVGDVDIDKIGMLFQYMHILICKKAYDLKNELRVES